MNNLKAELSSSIESARQHYFNESLAQFIKNDPQKFWSHIRDSHKPIDQVLVNESVVTCHKSIAEHFNTYFHSVFSKDDDPEFQCDPLVDNEVFVSYEGVVEMLLRLDPKGSVGPDNVPNAFLRRYAEPLAHFLTIIYRVSL